MTLLTGPSNLPISMAHKFNLYCSGGVGEAADFDFSLLGLGDIAVPGLLACLALRYDASRVVDMKARAQVSPKPFTLHEYILPCEPLNHEL